MSKASVRGRIVAITGAGSGIGRATAAALVAGGARVAIGDIDLAAAEKAAAELGSAAVAVRVDVADAASFTDFLRAAEQALGPIDVLVNNAGVMWVGPFAEEPDQWIERQIRVNLIGTINGVRSAAASMRPRGRGQIVTVASAASKLAAAGEATYTATKHGVYGYLQAARRELRDSGILLSVVMPGIVDTPLAAGTSPTGGAAPLTPEQVADAIVSVIARPRFELTIPSGIRLVEAARAISPQFLRDALDSAFVPDQLETADTSARAAYQARSLDTPQSKN
ncbi:SDR family NAD(P)-dependent oxidoreductase [Nocardia brasiliensis]|uniref:SDR family NAD(P)-dependent oxidoreductase n=1 Tax=Nocardia brasiliensis TaxID=37326 RepID=UPI001894B29D|nr:SDR family NAD(P)-dependent oxidoreductase [Nocardia brasiliensis]MBF6548893.1 SDR family NAD(P)-dependent oxidoreductase [Nocardia brasiliensis]